MKQFAPVTFCFLFILLVFASSACADGYAWGKTKWGMSPEQVSKALGEKIVFAKKNEKGEDVHILKGHKIGEFQYDVRMVFNAKKLNMVMIMGTGDSTSKKKACLDMAGSLRERLGRAYVITMGDAVSREWRTSESNISLMCFPDETWLSYEKKPNPGASKF
ncbi:MAG: hypothetical protein LBN96_01715 [Desulfovibrio sp.]|jgi:hypothetical protein|nr:hypothetical protein [Desulfovibrio sp.]